MNDINLELDQSLGQVWTPDEIASSMVEECFRLKPDIKNVLDPSCGPGTFSKALAKSSNNGISLVCYDVDKRMVQVTTKINFKHGLKGNIYHGDYLKDHDLGGKFDLIIMNPPYIRQEKISKANKEDYFSYLNGKIDGEIDKRSNLFVFFLIKAILDLAEDGLLCAIVYDAIQNTNYGKKTLSILNRYCEIASEKNIYAPFNNVMVDAKILIFRKRKIIASTASTDSECDDGLVTLEELLDTRRGTGFSLRKLFIAKPSDSIFSLSSPFFVKQAKLKGMVVEPDTFAYFINENSSKFKLAHKWLEQKADEVGGELKKITYPKVVGNILFNYYMRDKPRHLWNPGPIPASDNFYVSNVKYNFPAEVAWLLLNSDFYMSAILAASRNQGNGLLKIQLFEYKKVKVPDWRKLSLEKINFLREVADSLISANADYNTVKSVSNNQVKRIFL